MRVLLHHIHRGYIHNVSRVLYIHTSIHKVVHSQLLVPDAQPDYRMHAIENEYFELCNYSSLENIPGHQTRNYTPVWQMPRRRYVPFRCLPTTPRKEQRFKYLTRHSSRHISFASLAAIMGWGGVRGGGEKQPPRAKSAPLCGLPENAGAQNLFFLKKKEKEKEKKDLQVPAAQLLQPFRNLPTVNCTLHQKSTTSWKL